MNAKAIDSLCDLASSALGHYYMPGANAAVSEVHCEIMRTIRAVAHGKLPERETISRLRKLQAALTRAGDQNPKKAKTKR